MRRWFITGVSSGIGEALAQAALARGDAVVGAARDAEAARRFTAAAPGRSTGIQLDVTRAAEVASAVAQAVADGPLDVVVNNAGQSLFGAFEEVSPDEVRALFDVNVFGPWRVAQAVLPHMRERGRGTLVQLSSGCGVSGMPGLSAYCASKFALEGFSEALAAEVAAFGVRLMLVEPGAVASRFISHGTREAARRLPEYGFLSGQGKAPLDAYYGTCAASAESVAAAILQALDQPEPPARLVVGDDVRPGVREKGEKLIAAAAG